MKPRDILLALTVSVIWGLGFVATKFAVESFSAAQLTVLRFLIACLPALFLPRPRISWMLLILIGVTLFLGQFMLLFLAFRRGMPPGVASVTQQLQVFFTVLLAAIFLREIPHLRQSAGIVLAFAGLALIGASSGTDLPAVALTLALCGALSWAVGNILMKRLGNLPMTPLVVWASLVPPLPAFALSLWLEADSSLLHALASASWLSIAGLIYLGTLSTVLAYAMWGYLLSHYSAATITPFALLSPCVGVLASALVFGEAFPLMRYAGMALIMLGLVITLLPVDRKLPPVQVPPA